MKKKDFPLIVLEEMQNELQPLFNSHLSFAKQIKDDGVLYHLIDNFEYDFLFKVTTYDVKPGETYYLVTCKPASKRDIGVEEIWVPLKSLLSRFKTWIELINSYKNVKFIHEDPIIESYRAEFEKKFEILDEDADFAPFDLAKQAYINDYIETVKEKMKFLKEGRDEKEQKEISEIEKEVLEIQKNLTKETKREIMRRLSKFWAKARKIGFDLITKILIDYSAELTVKLIEHSTHL